jgi:ribonuclease HII
VAAPPLLTADREFVAGVDEVGRGCLAGPVVAAAVILPRGCRIDGVNDSKKLRPNQREAILPCILESAVCWAVGLAEAEEIDQANILRATYLAMRRALKELTPAPEFVLVDGSPIPNLGIPQQAIVKADSTFLAVAAASILAKVTRDRLMADLDTRFPGYDLARNKGYATISHLEALRRRGPSPVHRLSFRPVSMSAGLFPSESRSCRTARSCKLTEFETL